MLLILLSQAYAQFTNPIALQASAQPADVIIYHKASSKSVWLVTLTEGDNAINLAGHEPITVGVKTAATDASFQAFATGVVQSAAAGTVLFTINNQQWVTNIATVATWWGDVRLTDYDLPLPSLKIKLKPGYNTGNEVYAAPPNWEWQNNGVAVTDPVIINLRTNIAGVSSGAGNTTLNLDVTTPDETRVLPGIAIDVSTNGAEFTVSFDGAEAHDSSGATNANASTIFSTGTVPNERLDAQLQEWANVSTSTLAAVACVISMTNDQDNIANNSPTHIHDERPRQYCK
jgi:hypothetical protein